MSQILAKVFGVDDTAIAVSLFVQYCAAPVLLTASVASFLLAC
jgi:hypothetical protein